MKVLYLTKYSRNGASSRLRSYQYFPFLENEGIAVQVSPFFEETYLRNLYSGKGTSISNLMKSYCRRLSVLLTVFKYDAVIIEKELFPYFFSWFERLFYFFGVKYIVDYDDAVFHNYDLSSNRLISFLFKNKINKVMRFSGCVMAGNSYLADKAKDSGAKDIVIHPTVIDINKYEVKKDYNPSKVVIGWIGSPSTFKYVKNIKSVFEVLFKRYDVELHIVGAKEDLGLGDKVKFIPWNEADEVNLIAAFDIGIMPLENTPWEFGKCSYKLIQYMGCGVPVVASAIGMNNEVVDEDKNGYLVDADEQWIEKLSLLIEDSALREKLGKNGRLKVEERFNLHHNSHRLKSILENG